MGQISFYPQPIPTDAVDLAFPTPAYTQDLTDAQNDTSPPTDGLDAHFDALTAVDKSGPDTLNEMDSHLAEIDTHAPTLSTSLEQEAEDSYTAAVTNGQAGVDDFASSKTGARGRIFPGGIFTWLAAQKGQQFGSHANVDQNAAELGIFEQLGFHFAPIVGQPPFPTKWWIHTGPNDTPEVFVRAELVSDNPVFFSMWHDDFAAVQPGADWNFYVNVDPCKEGVFCCTVRLYQDDTHYKAMTLQIYIAVDIAHSGHRPPETCPVDPGNPLPTPGGGGGGGGGNGGGAGGGKKSQ